MATLQTSLTCTGAASTDGSRPKGDIQRLVGILRSQPALPTFAATAKLDGGRTYRLRDTTDIFLDIDEWRLRLIAGLEVFVVELGECINLEGVGIL